jgi:hypothetical protein
MIHQESSGEEKVIWGLNFITKDSCGIEDTDLLNFGFNVIFVNLKTMIECLRNGSREGSHWDVFIIQKIFLIFIQIHKNYFIHSVLKCVGNK